MLGKALTEKSYIISVVVLATGLLGTAGGVRLVAKHNEDDLQRAVQITAEQSIHTLTASLQRYELGLLGARGVVFAAGEEGLNREIFRRYAQSRDFKAEFPGARGFGFVRKVPAQDVDRFLNTARSDGRPDFSIRQLETHEGDRYVIQYIEPVAANQPAIGLDIASEAKRRFAAESSMRTGKPTLTGPITLVQSAGKPQQSFLFLLPIYRSAQPLASQEARMEDTVGWSFAPLEMESVLGDAGLQREQARIVLEDVTDGAMPVMFYQTAAMPEKVMASFSINQKLYGREWRMRLEVFPAFVVKQRLHDVRWIALSGIVTSLILAVLTWIGVTQRRRRQELIATRARLASIVENAIDAVISKTTDGTILSWNRGAERLLGYTAKEAIGQCAGRLIVPDDLQAEEADLLNRIARGTWMESFESRRRCKDGRLVDVSVAVAPIRDAKGRIIGASTTMRDISRQKAAESQLQNMNAHLEAQVTERTAALDAARSTLRSVLDAVPSMIGYWDKDLINRVANHAYQKRFGDDVEALPGRSMRDLLGDTLFEENRPYIDGALRGEAQSFERTIRTPEGKNRHALAHYLPDVVNGSVNGFYVIVHDVTDLVESRLKLASALRENELLLQAIEQHLLYSVTDAQGRIIDVNRRFCEAHGYAREALIGRDHRLLKSGIHRPEFWKNMWGTLAEDQAWRGDICNRTKDGDLRWFDTVIASHAAADGSAERYVALRVDVTARKQIDAEMVRLNALLGNVLRAASEVSIIATDKEGLITVFNSGAQRMLGYTEAEMVGFRTPACFHLPEEVDIRGRELSASYGMLIEGFRVFLHVPELKGAETREWTYVRKDGTTLTVSLVVTAICDDQGGTLGYLGIATDITARERYQRELAAARDQLAVAADVAQLGIWSWTLADNSLQWNKRMFELYAQSAALQDNGLNYQHWYERVHPEDVEATAACLTDAVAGRGQYDPVFRVVRPDGSVRYVQAGAVVERDDDGNAVRVTGINLDITERRQFEYGLIEARQHAEFANRAKSQFLANMSHEIRTPMNAVLGMIRLLQKTHLEPRQRDYAAKAQTAATSLLGLLNDILDFSKIDAGKLELELHPFDLEQLMRDLGVVLSGSYDKKDVEVLYEIDPSLPSALIGDRMRLQQILINLSGNAIKFTEQGQVAISLAGIEREDRLLKLRVSVTDTGIGISDEQRERIFEGFTQAESSTTRRFGGTGLGLAISQRLVQLMGGELRVESRLGQGSCFWFDITLQTAEDKPLAKVEGHANVLVVDDNRLVATVMVQTLQNLGWRADYAAGGLAAIERVRESVAQRQPYDVVLMDWRMPDLDGVNAANLIRQYASRGQPPVVIMVTAFGREILSEIVDQGKAPFVDFLTKPATPQQLVDAIQCAIKGICRLQPAGREASQQRLLGMHLLLVEDNALNRQVATELLKAEGAHVMTAENGTSGVALATDAANVFDVVIMDVQMPDIDGMEATRRIRANSGTHTLPVLAMTANASVEDRMACLAAGMNDHVGKPFDMDHVVGILQALTGRIPACDEAKHVVPDDPDGLVEPLPGVLKRFGDKRDIFRNAVTYFLPECQRLVEELTVWIANGSARDAAETLHALKGVAGTLGAVALAGYAADLEKRLKAESAVPVEHLLDADALEELSRLIRDSATRLADLLSDVPSLSQARLVIAPDDWRSRLQEIANALHDGNLLAIDLVETLLTCTPEPDLPRIQTLADQIRSMQFDIALTLAKKILGEK